LDPFLRYAEPHAETREAWVYGGGGAQGLLGSGGPYVPRTCERIRGVLYGVLRAGIQHATASILALAFVVLWPHASPSDSPGALHIATFVTLCEAYLGIDPEIDLRKYFFHV
jgi:hypothetical protein